MQGPNDLLAGNEWNYNPNEVKNKLQDNPGYTAVGRERKEPSDAPGVQPGDAVRELEGRDLAQVLSRGFVIALSFTGAGLISLVTLPWFLATPVFMLGGMIYKSAKGYGEQGETAWEGALRGVNFGSLPHMLAASLIYNALDERTSTLEFMNAINENPWMSYSERKIRALMEEADGLIAEAKRKEDDFKHEMAEYENDKELKFKNDVFEGFLSHTTNINDLYEQAIEKYENVYWIHMYGDDHVVLPPQHKAKWKGALESQSKSLSESDGFQPHQLTRQQNTYFKDTLDLRNNLVLRESQFEFLFDRKISDIVKKKLEGVESFYKPANHEGKEEIDFDKVSKQCEYYGYRIIAERQTEETDGAVDAEVLSKLEEKWDLLYNPIKGLEDWKIRFRMIAELEETFPPTTK